MKDKKQTRLEILRDIRENGGFNNFRNWNTEQKADWVFANYDCTKYTAKQVAYSI